MNQLPGFNLLQRHGVTNFSKLAALWHLVHEGPTDISRLGRACGVSVSHATGVVDGLERNGLVERQRTPDNDRRTVMVVATEMGFKLVKEVRDALSK